MSIDLGAYLARQKAAIDEALAAQVEAWRRSAPARLVDAMGYSLLAGGKRLRPLLVLAAFEACGGPAGRRALAEDLAVALECIHTYSLIHDDLPAMDDDDLRRGRPTCHVVYGEAAAILAGDALLTEAFARMAAGEEGERLELVGLLAQAAGAAGMVGGQKMDLEMEGRPSLEEVEGVHRRKTGALLRAAAEGGAIAAGAPEGMRSALGAYGEALGLAFQIADDLLDVMGKVEEMGKRQGGDEAKGKPTYPALVGLETSRELAKEAKARALAAIAEMGEEAEPLRAIARFTVDRTA